MRWGLISAVPFEANLLIKRLCLKQPPKSDLLGLFIGNNVLYISSGIGAVNTGHATTLLIKEFLPQAVIAFGIGGAYPSSGLKIGDIAVAEKEIYADTGVLLKNGFHGLNTIGIPLIKKGKKKYFNEFPLDTKLIKKAMRVLPTVHKGVFLTVSTSTGTLKRANELSRKCNAICENMEGASVAHICTMYGIPLLELRGISNMVEDRDLRKWDKALASRRCQEAVLKIISLI
ncbi:MAG: futalosine hydrolase [Nitrospirae bacterium]|nr:futalosine hydrolase [Nitrospirota bacterium]